MAQQQEENECDESVMSKTVLLSPSDDNIGDTSFPLVFKCAGCGQIVGDSMSWVCANEDLRTISLKRTKFPLFCLFSVLFCLCISARIHFRICRCCDDYDKQTYQGCNKTVLLLPVPVMAAVYFVTLLCKFGIIRL